MIVAGRHLSWALALGLATSGAMACGGTNRTIKRTSASSNEGGDLSGYWNDRDARQVAESMITQALQEPWISEFQQKNEGRRPIIKLRGVIKRTDDRNVNEQFFTKQVESALLKSRKVRVVAADVQENINVAERERQMKHASDETAKSMGQEVGADFTLQTFVNSQNETDGEGRSVRAYLVQMELLDVQTNEKVWIGEEPIRKIIEQDRVRF